MAEIKKYFDTMGNELIPVTGLNIQQNYNVEGGMCGRLSFSNNKEIYDYILTQKPLHETIITAPDHDIIKQFTIFKDMEIGHNAEDSTDILKQTFYYNVQSGHDMFAQASIKLYISNNQNDKITEIDGDTMGIGSYWGNVRLHLRIYGIANIVDDKLNNYCYVYIGLREVNGVFDTVNGQLKSKILEYVMAEPNFLNRSFAGKNWIVFQPKELVFDSTENTTQGGGYGSGEMPHDEVSIPTLPGVNISDCGSSLYMLSPSQMINLRKWLWSSDWQDNIKKLRTDPMQNIISVSITDLNIPTVGETAIYIGNVESTVTGGLINNTFISLDCGTITLEEYYGTFADYEPFCATTLYLPKVGFVQIPADIVVNNSINVVYHVELTSGEGLCYVILTSKRDGFTYIWNTYTCHVTSNIMLSAQDHTQQLTALGNAIINTTAQVSGAIANPATVPSAMAGIASSCLDVATTKNPTLTRGNIGNMSASMCFKKPYIMINRTNLVKPTSFRENNGHLINYTSKISGHAGFLKTRDYHAEFNAPYNHKMEIERIMNEGVFING